MRHSLTLLLFVLSLLLSACSSSESVLQFIKPEKGDLKKVASGKIAYYNPPAITLQSEKFDINKTNHDSVSFENYLYGQFAKTLGEQSVSVKLVKQNGTVPSELLDSLSIMNYDYKKLTDFLESSKCNYVMIIKSVDFKIWTNNSANKKQIFKDYNIPSTDVDQMGLMAAMKIDVWDVAAKRKVLSIAPYEKSSMMPRPGYDTYKEYAGTAVENFVNYLSGKVNTDEKELSTLLYISPGFNPDKIKAGKIGLIVNNQATVKEYKDAFKSEFPDSGKFYQKVCDSFSQLLKNNYPNMSLSSLQEKADTILFTNNIINKKYYDDLKNQFTNTKNDFLLILKDITLDESSEWGMGVGIRIPLSGGGITPFAGPTKKNLLHIKISYELWDAAKQNRIISTSSNGAEDTGIFGLATRAAINDAIDMAVENLVKFITNGDKD